MKKVLTHSRIVILIVFGIVTALLWALALGLGEGNGVYYFGPVFLTILTAYLFYAAVAKNKN